MNCKIINKHCFVRKGLKLYCSKCGEAILQDRYNCHRHARMDNFQEYDLIESIRENEEFAYAFLPYKDKMGFVVFTPKLIPTGFNDHYKGAKWVEVYKAILDVKRRKIIEKEGNLRNIEFWKKQNMYCLNAGSVYENVYKLFHIPGMSSLEMFLDILCHRGFRYEAVLTDDEARTVLNEELSPNVEKKIGYTWTEDGAIYGKKVEVNGTILLQLEICRKKADERIKMLVGENYFFSDQELDLRTLLRERYLHHISDEEIRLFANANPTLGLMNYWERSQKNLLLPLLSPMYDESLELLCKAGCSVIADNFYECWALRGRERNSDVKKWLGAPIKVVRRIQPDCLKDKEIFLKIYQLYRTMPEFFETGDITYGLIQLLWENEIAARENLPTRIEGYSQIHPKIRKRMAKFLQEKQCSSHYRSYRMYVDYLNFSREENFEGYTPRYLERAHTRAMLANYQPLKVDEEMFKNRLDSLWYKSLESSFPKEAALFEDDKFFIRSPLNTTEMKSEGMTLHHCVYGYCRSVADGTTRIYFLRRKGEPNVPYGTIEVRGNRVLQLKAKYNRRVDLNAQAFTKKWASAKGLTVEHTDFDFV